VCEKEGDGGGGDPTEKVFVKRGLGLMQGYAKAEGGGGGRGGGGEEGND